MARYRKIDVRIWNDQKFRALSDSAKLAFILVLTHPDTTQIGMLRARAVSLSFELGWQVDAMSDAINEATRMGMLMVDEKAGLMVIPNFLRYNPPNGPNSLNSWAELIDLMPECTLRHKTVVALKGYLDSLSDGMKKGINNDLVNAIGKAQLMLSEMPCEMPCHIQKQEQEQEQEIEKEKKKRKISAPKKALVFPPDVTEENIKDYFTKCGGKAKVTQRMIDGIVKKAEEVGAKPNEAFNHFLARGWKTFYPDSWLNDQRKQNHSQSNLAFVAPPEYDDVPM